jgi:hypothetical protein
MYTMWGRCVGFFNHCMINTPPVGFPRRTLAQPIRPFQPWAGGMGMGRDRLWSLKFAGLSMIAWVKKLQWICHYSLSKMNHPTEKIPFFLATSRGVA